MLYYRVNEYVNLECPHKPSQSQNQKKQASKLVPPLISPSEGKSTPKLRE